MNPGYYLKAASFTLCLAVPVMCPAGVALGTYWLCPVLFFVVLPLLGRALGGDPTAHYGPVSPSPWLRTYLDLLPYGYLPVWLGAFAWTAGLLASAELSASATVAVAFSLGIASAVSTCVAHEIMHRSGRLDQAYARVMVALCGYGHLMLEHSAHHAHVGDVAIGGTPRLGESAYAFVWRDVQQGYRNAMAIESRRLRYGKLSAWHHHIAQNYAFSALFLLVFTAIWGLPAAALYLFQALFSVFAVQMITYIQHYGLVRERDEPVGGHHSWADNCMVANALTLNNNHHSRHHLEPRTPYYDLRAHRQAPRLPASYMLMFVLALAPPLWRMVMDKRLARHRRSRVGRNPMLFNV
jgi:alkane 1-monooxygenase